MLKGGLRVRRRGDGRLQEHEAVPGTVWICPAGIREDMIHLYGEIEESVHIYLPAAPFRLDGAARSRPRPRAKSVCITMAVSAIR